MGTQESEGLTRRETLKRGLKLGAVLWVTPVVQVVGMRPAFAQTVSPDPCVRTAAFKAKTDGDGFENDPGTLFCAPCGGAEGVDGDEYFTLVAVLDEEGETEQVTVTLKPGTDCEITDIWAKGGADPGSCGQGLVAPGGQSATVGRPPNGAGISHVEVCFTCCVED
jgi:hypothetical protein